MTVYANEGILPYLTYMELGSSMRAQHSLVHALPGKEVQVLRQEDWHPVGTYRATDTACRLQGRDGRNLFLKNERPEVPYACSIVATMLGIDAPGIGQAVWAGRSWMVQEWIPNTRTAFEWEMEHDERLLPSLDTPSYREWRNRLLVLDAIIHNCDRNPSNILIEHDSMNRHRKYWAIDMKMACDTSRSIADASLPAHLPEGMEGILCSWKENGHSADAVLGQVLGAEKYSALCARRDAVHAWYHATRGKSSGGAS